jgi:hypothetical protein
MMKKIGDAFDVVFVAFAWAIVLAWLAFVVSRAGWRAFSVAVLPIYCAYILGSGRGYRKWKRFQERIEKGQLP